EVRATDAVIASRSDRGGLELFGGGHQPAEAARGPLPPKPDERKRGAVRPRHEERGRSVWLLPPASHSDDVGRCWLLDTLDASSQTVTGSPRKNSPLPSP